MSEQINATKKKQIEDLNDALNKAIEIVEDQKAQITKLETQVQEYHLLKKKFIENK